MHGFDHDVYFAGRAVRVLVLIGALNDLARNTDAGLGFDLRDRVLGGVKEELAETGAVTHVREDEAAHVAQSVDPTV